MISLSEKRIAWKKMESGREGNGALVVNIFMSEVLHTPQ